MQISSRFTIALHMLICMGFFEKDKKLTSEVLAESINVNPVIVRKILLQLKANELITVVRGTGGSSIAKPLEQISLLDIYRAVDCVGKDKNLFAFHDNPNPKCIIGKNIHNILDYRLAKAQYSLEKNLATVTLKDVLEDTDKVLEYYGDKYMISKKI